MRVYPLGGERASVEYVIVLPIVPEWRRGCEVVYVGGSSAVLGDGEERVRGQISLCSIAERVAAARELTSSLR